jgi:copper resistance protein D
VRHGRAVAGALLVTVAACLLCWALAYPATDLTPAVLRAVADVAAATALGLALVPLLDGPRHRDELRRRAAAPLLVAAAVWAVAEVARLVAAAADAVGTTPLRVPATMACDYAVVTAPGRAGLLTVVAAVGVGVLTAARTTLPTAVPAGVAAIGVIGHPLTGHLADRALGGVAIAVHALAAAAWCGVLAALALTVSHRGQWARVLPGFSRLSLGCVLVLLVAGVAAGVTLLDSPAALLTTGWGRILTLKLGLTAVLLLLGRRHRTLWVPAARAHHVTAAASGTRARLELAVMAAALTAAAALSVTG